MPILDTILSFNINNFSDLYSGIIKVNQAVNSAPTLMKISISSHVVSKPKFSTVFEIFQLKNITKSRQNLLLNGL